MLVTNGKIIVTSPESVLELQEAHSKLQSVYPDVFSISGPDENGAKPEYWIDVPETHTFASLKETLPELKYKAINENTFKDNRSYTRTVSVTLTVEEKRMIADDIVAKENELNDLEQEKKAAVSRYSEQQKQLEAAKNLAVQRYTRGKEDRDLVLNKVYDFEQRKIYWVDEEENVMDTSDFTQSDLQMKIDFGVETNNAATSEEGGGSDEGKEDLLDFNFEHEKPDNAETSETGTTEPGADGSEAGSSEEVKDEAQGKTKKSKSKEKEESSGE